MNLMIYFLLISSLSTTIICMLKNKKAFDENDISEIIYSGRKNVLNSKNHKLKLLDKGKLGATQHSIVWKGKYDDTKVAIKFVMDKESFDHEIEIFEILNATNDKNIERFGIPRIYYYGQILGKYNVIAMSLFGETLGDHYKSNEDPPSNLDILKIFKRTVKVLQYIHSKNVVHNDIKPTNLFLSLRDEEVFVGDFDLATINKNQTKGFTPLFASSNYYARLPRTAMDDIQSLVFTIWYIANMPFDSSYDAEGEVLLKCEQKGEDEALAKMLDKCSYFTNVHVHHAMIRICAGEMLVKKPSPDHELIIKILDKQINKVKRDLRSAYELDTKPSNSRSRSYLDFMRFSRPDSCSWKMNCLPSPRKLSRRLSKQPSIDTVEE